MNQKVKTTLFYLPLLTLIYILGFIGLLVKILAVLILIPIERVLTILKPKGIDKNEKGSV